MAVPASVQRWAPQIQAAAAKAGIDPRLLMAVVWAESGGNPNAVSSAGAIGLTQLMPGTARGLGVNPRDPVQNLEGGARYLAQQLRAFGGDLHKALAAYNAGPGNVRKYGGVPPFTETRAYIPRVLGYMNQIGGSAGINFSPASVTLPSFPVPGVPGGSFPTFTVPSYPREPLPIPAANLATWDERLAAANRALREAQAAEKLGKAQVEGEFKRFLDSFRREVGTQREGVMDEAADRNLALQPIFVNPRMREISSRAAEVEAEATAQKADRLNALRQMVKNAERAKTDVEELNRRDKARVRAELDRLIGI